MPDIKTKESIEEPKRDEKTEATSEPVRVMAHNRPKIKEEVSVESKEIPHDVKTLDRSASVSERVREQPTFRQKESPSEVKTDEPMHHVLPVQARKGNTEPKQIVRNIKVLDKVAVLSDRVRDTYVRTKEQSQRLVEDDSASPTDYAEKQIQGAAEDAVNDAERTASDGAKAAYHKSREAYRRYKDTKKENPLPEDDRYAYEQKPVEVRQNQIKTVQSTQQSLQQNAEVRTSNIRTTQTRTIKTVPTTNRTIKQTAKSTGTATVKTASNTIKTTHRTVKTAQQTSKTAVKTAGATAKAAEKSAQATAKAAKAAAAAAKATAKALVEAAKVIAKVTVEAVKAIVAAVKELIAAIAAGGWVAVVIIVVICLIAIIAGCCFGIFFSSEDTGDGPTMHEVVQEINTEYEEKLENIKDSHSYDVLEMSGSRAVWPEVLSVYAVKLTTDPDDPQEVATLNEEKQEMLTEIFWEMNTISYSLKTEEVIVTEETDDGRGNIIVTETVETITTLKIVVGHKTADQMADAYNFDDFQMEQLNALLDEDNGSLWAAVLYGVYGEDDQIVAVALSQVGNIGGHPYWSWYGFGSRVEWCACFVSWCANECGYIIVIP